MYYQDVDNVRRNRVTMLKDRAGWNAVLSWEITSAPIVEPVSVADVKEYSHVDFSDDDNKILKLIKGAREYIQRFTGVYLIPVTVSSNVRNELGGVRLFPQPARNIKNSEGKDLDIQEPFDVQVVTFDAGYEAADVPEVFKTAILMQVDFVLNGGIGFSTEVRDTLRAEVRT